VSILRTDKAIDIGKSNVVFRLRMPDATLWVARLRNPLVQKSVIADKALREQYQRNLLESEIATMVYIKRKTKIPVPEIYTYALDRKSTLGTPYIIMECINGRPYPHPFDERNVMTDNDIIKVHNELVSATAQLASLSFDKIGMLRFDKSEPDGIRIDSIVDRKGRSYGPFSNSKEFFVTRARIVHDGEKNAKASMDQLETALLHMQAAQHAAHPDFMKGPFPIKHNDLHWQNVLFNSKCESVGIIDWEWAHTVPVESCTVLPFNLASYVRPKCAHPPEEFEDRAVRSFREKVPNCAVNEVQGTRQRQIVACLDRYNWQDVRKNHAPRLKELIASFSPKSV
jgi:aminoglycoside phosphotransferase (APT) family kinase protein